jgi:hypothetical protein
MSKDKFQTNSATYHHAGITQYPDNQTIFMSCSN